MSQLHSFGVGGIPFSLLCLLIYNVSHNDRDVLNSFFLFFSPLFFFIFLLFYSSSDVLFLLPPPLLFFPLFNLEPLEFLDLVNE